MRSGRGVVFVLVCVVSAAMHCWAGDDNADVKVQLESLKQQAAALAQQIEQLQQKIDQRPVAAVQSTAHVSEVAYPAQGPAPTHGFLERKPGDRLTSTHRAVNFLYTATSTSRSMSPPRASAESWRMAPRLLAIWDGCPISPPISRILVFAGFNR